MIIVHESSSETNQTNKKPNMFSLELSTKLFAVPSKGFLKVELKNLARKTQEVLITLESAVFTIRNHEKELFPLEQLSMILEPLETKSFTIYVKERFPEKFNFDNIRLRSPEGHLTIAHCDTKQKSGSWELYDSNGMMCLASETDHELHWGSYTQKMILDMETEDLKYQKKRYSKEREEYEIRKENQEKQSSKESGSEKEKKGFECCCIIS